MKTVTYSAACLLMGAMLVMSCRNVPAEDVSAVLKKTAAGREASQRLTIAWHEEIPREQRLRLSAASGAGVELIVYEFDHACGDEHREACWERRDKSPPDDSGILARLAEPLSRADLAAVGVQTDVFPGTPRFSLEVSVEGGPAVTAAGPMSLVEQSPELTRFRNLVHGLAR